MSRGNFTRDDQAQGVVAAVKVLWRFVQHLPILLQLLIPITVLAVLASSLPQLFLWMVGEFLRCGQQSNCRSYLPKPFLIEVEPSLWILAAIVIGTCITRVIGWTMFEISGQWSAQRLHRKMIDGLARVRVTYFDEHPSGRLLSRIVGDFEELRVEGVIRLGDSLNALVEILVIAVVVSYANPYMALAIVPALLAFYYLQCQVAPMTQHIGILESIKKGETLHRETDLIEGGRVFALYHRAQALMLKLSEALVKWIELSLLRTQIEFWGRFWMSTISSLYTFCAMLCLLLALNQDVLTATVAGVILSGLFRLGMAFHWLNWSTVSLNETTAHARRIFEFVDLPNEQSEEGKQQFSDNNLDGSRLSGDIEFLNFSASYREDLPEVLRNVNVRLPAKTHIALVGRTGSGKSSLVQSLYRMVYVRAGDIQIGGQSIYRYSIDSIRALFAIVPQDPYLFEGTVRSNLDRYGNYNDEQLQSALGSVDLQLQLGFAIKEGGQNLSLGERQLVCLARALLSDTPYIVMDEPTSGIDNITDAKIQRVLYSVFKGKTVLTIAHRLETLGRCDLVIELANGQIIRAQQNDPALKAHWP